MTREEFIGILDREGYSYDIDGGSIVVNHDSDVGFKELDIPDNVIFNNDGNVFMGISEIHPSVVLNNNGGFFLFDDNDLRIATNDYSPGHYIFYSKDHYEGWLKNIDNKRLINLMIKQGVFER